MPRGGSANNAVIVENPGSPGSTADNAVIVDATAITGVEPTRTIIPGGSTEVSSPGATITAGDITSFEKVIRDTIPRNVANV